MAALTTQFEGYRYNASTSTNPGSHEVLFMLSDLDDNEPETAIALTSALIPPTLFGSTLKNWSIEEYKNNKACLIRATYQNKEVSSDKPQELDAEQFSFDTTGYTEHLTVDLGDFWKSDGAPDLGGVIGYDGERVNGVDVTRPQFNFSIRKQYYSTDVTDEFQQIIADVTGTVNLEKFGPYEAESVLFRGGGGSDSNGIFTITYGFSYRPNREEHPFGPFTIPFLPGWWYAEAQYEDSVDEANTQIIKEMKHAYARKIYPLADFSQLGLNF